MPTDKLPPDPRSQMTDRKKFMVRVLHTPRVVTTVALYLAKRDNITRPTLAVRRACRFLDIPDDYNPVSDPTMRACVKQMKKHLASD